MATTLDDRDPSFLYQGVWNQGGTPGAELNNTTTWTALSGSLIYFNFSGK